MSTVKLSPDVVEAAAAGSGPRTKRARVALFIGSLVFALAAFLALDWFLSATILAPDPLATASHNNHNNCFARDPQRVFALQPNCTCTRAWLKESFAFATNNLGFRDKEVRDVPPTDPRPRVLLLGSSELEGMLPWDESFVGRLQKQFPQYAFINAGIEGYSPSTYLITARMLLDKNIQVDDVIVFVDVADVQNEAAYFRDAGGTGAVTGPANKVKISDGYGDLRLNLGKNLLITDGVLDYLERWAVKLGLYHLDLGHGGNEFDLVRSAWTYRAVPESEPYEAGYGPLGVSGGITKEKEKMDRLWQELKQRNIPLSVVVFPWPAQIAHDTADSRQVQIWRDWCAGKCQRFVSVFPEFFQAKASCRWNQPGCWYEEYFVFGDIHYNAAGHALMADVLNKSLTETPPKKRTANSAQGNAADQPAAAHAPS